MVVTEYRIPMPFSVEEYKIGQLFMIAKHSNEQSESGEGVEVVHNVPHEDEVNGPGRYTEKRIHLSSRLPYFIQSIIPKVFYVTEKSWNYYPYTETEYTCSFLPRFSIFIKTRYENNAGTTENCLGLTEEELRTREVEFIDIGEDEVSAKHYKSGEDPKYFKSKLTGRGPLAKDWRETSEPIMCSYKLVSTSFEVWGLQGRVEEFAQKAIREILLLGHRQAFVWIDEWYGMTEEDVRNFELKMQSETNEKVLGVPVENGEEAEEGETKAENESVDEKGSKTADKTVDDGNNGPSNSLASSLKSWLTWS